MTKIKNEIILGLGSNIGDSISAFKKCCELIQETIGDIVSKSSIYQSEPVEFLDQPRFYNMVIYVRTFTLMTACEILHSTQKIENLIGRIKLIPKGPRIIDIDLLFVDNLVISSPELTIPHPEIYNRDFVYLPLNEISKNVKNIILPQIASQKLDTTHKTEFSI